MKRILTAFMAALLLVSCELTEDEIKHREERQELPKSSASHADFTLFTFRGHDYIWFTQEYFGSTVDYQQGGVVHDPDCRKCHGEIVEEEGIVTRDEEELSEYERIFGRHN